MRVVWCALVAAGCGTPSTDPFLLENADCSLVNNFKVDGAATPWTDCRVYWSAPPFQTLTVELTIPNTTGSFLSPGAGWLRASLHAPGDVDATLATTPFEPPDRLPSSVPEDKLVLDMPVMPCGNLGEAMEMVRVMADVGDASLSFSMSFDGTCTPQGSPMASYSGGFIVTAAAKAGSMLGGDPATVVTPTE